MSSLGFYFADGIFSLPQDYTKALKLWHKAAELGHSTAYFNIGACCDTGTGVEVEEVRMEAGGARPLPRGKKVIRPLEGSKQNNEHSACFQLRLESEPQDRERVCVREKQISQGESVWFSQSQD